MNQTDLEHALGGLGLGPIRYLQQIGSTNDEAAAWLNAGAPDLALVVADEQTAGRGRLDRRWFTPPGAALAFSLALRPGPGAPEPYLPRATALGALGVSGALRTLWGLPAEIKWPNDVLVGRRKTAGILAEAHWQGERLLGIVLGIGVNVAPASVPPAGELVYPATCVEADLNRPVDRLELLRAILVEVLDWRTQLGEPAFLQAWTNRLAFRGELVRLSAPNGETVEGELLDLDEDGALRLRGADGQILIFHSGEIRMRPV